MNLRTILIEKYITPNFIDERGFFVYTDNYGNTIKILDTDGYLHHRRIRVPNQLPGLQESFNQINGSLTDGEIRNNIDIEQRRMFLMEEVLKKIQNEEYLNEGFSTKEEFLKTSLSNIKAEEDRNGKKYITVDYKKNI